MISHERGDVRETDAGSLFTWFCLVETMDGRAVRASTLLITSSDSEGKGGKQRYGSRYC